MLLAAAMLVSAMPAAGQETIRFAIESFLVDGNTLLDESELEAVLAPFHGEEKGADDVERARAALEAHYHGQGYPTVLVNIPEQSVERGEIRLNVIESRVRRLRITGNRYFTMERIRRELPSLAPGKVLYLPEVREDLARLNRNPDLKVAPTLSPGRVLGTIDVELKVEDHLPLHGSLEVNNRSTHTTTDTRVNGAIRYDNLWQRDHSAAFQFQTSPEDTSEVQALSASYVMPAPWHLDRMISVYGIWSDSDTATGEGFQIIGSGTIFGLRYLIPLQGMDAYQHNLAMGFDYKNFRESRIFGTVEDVPVSYVPASLAYNALAADTTGATRFSAVLNLSFRGMGVHDNDFARKRAAARENYLYLTLGIERNQKLPLDCGLFVKLDGQIADQALIPNEQYSAGGIASVRGYLENEALGDDAVHLTTELLSPELTTLAGMQAAKGSLQAYVAYDLAGLMVKDALPGEDEATWLRGIGCGLKGNWGRHLEMRLDWGMALKATDQTDRGKNRWYYKLKYLF